ncbi:MAG: toxin-antitoxin system YwqK family antitoxin [Ilyomonas sp.]
MRYLFLFTLLIFSAAASAQCKTFKIGVKGDTLNCVDKNDLKQGKWVVYTESLRGEPGFDEEGVFKDGKKEGVWRKYSLMGDLIAIENYKWGYKNGTCRYFNLAGLMREENWKAVNPDNPYDTVEVPDLVDPYKVDLKVVKIEGTSVKHGTWTYYDPQMGTITKTEEYFLDKLQSPNKKLLAKDVDANAATDSSLQAAKPDAKNKPAEVLQYEKKHSGKKKIRVRDGATGVN